MIAKTEMKSVFRVQTRDPSPKDPGWVWESNRTPRSDTTACMMSRPSILPNGQIEEVRLSTLESLADMRRLSTEQGHLRHPVMEGPSSLPRRPAS